MTSYQHIVIGTGSMGAAACYHLAARGQKVLGIDRFDPPHDLGAHGGQSRIIRKAYFEHPDYIPLLQRAYEGWKTIEKLSGEKIYHETGLLYAGPPDHELIQKIKQSANLYDISLENISRNKFPQFSFPGNYEWLFEPEAGFLLPDIAINSYLTEAKKAGAEIHCNEKVLNWERRGSEIIVRTDKSSYATEKIIFTAGPFSSRILPFTQKNLTITRQVLAWIKPDNPVHYQLNDFPCWLAASHDVAGAYYGFPVLPPQITKGPKGIKIALHYPGTATDPDLVNREISDDDIRHINEFVHKHIPGAAGKITYAKICLYSMTPDEHFVIDLVPDSEGLACMAWGFSGHGFKFVPVVGEVLADLAMYGKTELPIVFLSAERFTRKE